MVTMPNNLIAWKTSRLAERQSRGELLPIISVGDDETLLALREKIIKGKGYSVLSLTSVEAELIAHSSEPHLWVFCSTIDLGQLAYLACAVRRQSPRSLLLLLAGARPVGCEAALFQRVLSPIDGVDELLETIGELAIAD